MVNYYVYGTVACIIILLLIALVFMIRLLRKKKIASSIPEEVLADFKKAEELAKNNDMTPQEILWKVYMDRIPQKEQEQVYSSIPQYTNPPQQPQIPRQPPRLNNLNQYQQNIKQGVKQEVKKQPDNKLAGLFRKRLQS